MAIDDNTSYELTGAQVKDLASRIKGNTTLAKDLTGGESRTSKLIYMAWIDIDNAQRIADEISDTILTVQNNMVYRFFYAATGNEIKSPDDLGALIETGYVIEYLNQPGSSDDDNAQETMLVTVAKCIVDDEDEEIYHAELQLKSISQATGNVISKNIVVDHAPSGASYWYKTTTTEGPAGRVACLVQDMFGSGEVNGITAEINASLPEGVDPLGSSLVWSVMGLLFRDPKTGEFCKTISQIRALLRSGSSYHGKVVYIPYDEGGSAGRVITRYGWTGNTSTGHGFVDILNLNTGELRTYNVADISQAGYTDNRQYCWYYVYVDSTKVNFPYGRFEDNATIYDVATDTPTSKFEVTYDANNNLYMASGTSAASDWKQINNVAPAQMTGASSSTAGTSGVVPAPAAGDENKVLSGAGTWVNQSGGGSDSNYFFMLDTIPTSGTAANPTNLRGTTGVSTTQYNELVAAITANKNIILVRDSTYHGFYRVEEALIQGTGYVVLSISSFAEIPFFSLHGEAEITVFDPTYDPTNYPNGAALCVYSEANYLVDGNGTVSSTNLATDAVTSDKIDWSTICYSNSHTETNGAFRIINKSATRTINDGDNEFTVSISSQVPTGFVPIGIVGMDFSGPGYSRIIVTRNYIVGNTISCCFYQTYGSSQSISIAWKILCIKSAN